MKRIIIISALFAFCIFVSVYTVHHVNNVTQRLDTDVQAVLVAMENEEKESIVQSIERIVTFWDQEERKLMHLVRHAQIDDLGKSIARLKALALGEDYPELAAELSSIRWQMEHISRNERISFRNLLRRQQMRLRSLESVQA